MKNLRSVSRDSRQIRCSQQVPRRAVRAARLRLEPLEDRWLPATITWISPIGGDWSNPVFWSDGVTNRLPGPGDDAVIPALAGDQTVAYSSGTTQIQSLTSSARFSLAGGFLSVTGSVSVSRPFTLSGGATLADATVLAGTTISSTGGTVSGITLDGGLSVYDSWVTVVNGLTVNGQLGISTSIREASSQLRFSGAQTVGGTGSISLNDPGNAQLLISTAACTVTIGPNIAVNMGGGGLVSNYADSTYIFQGTLTARSGYFGFDAAVIDTPNFRNEGVLQVMNSASLGLRNTWNNQGTIRAFGTGRIDVNGAGALLADTTITAESSSSVFFSGALNLAGHTLNLSGGAGAFVFYLAGGNLENGTLSTPDGAALRGVGGTLTAMTVNSYLDFTGFSNSLFQVGSPSVNIQDGLTLNGTLSLGDGGNSNNGTVRFTNTQTVDGTGSIGMGGSLANLLVITNPNITVTFGPDFTIHGRVGTITSNFASSSYDFRGTVSADDTYASGGIGIDGNWRNEGVMQTAGPGTLGLSGTWTNTGAIRGDGTGRLNVGGAWTHFGTMGVSGHVELRIGNAGTWQSPNPLTATAGTAVYLGGDFIAVGGGTIALAAPLTLSGPLNFRLTGTLRDGTINMMDGAVLLPGVGQVPPYPTLDRVTVNGDVFAHGITSLTIQDGLTINGRLIIHTDAPFPDDATAVRLRGTQTIDGSGAIVFDGRGPNVLQIDTTNTTVSVCTNVYATQLGPNQSSSIIFAIEDHLPANHNSRFLFCGLIQANAGVYISFPRNSGLADDGVIQIDQGGRIEASGDFVSAGRMTIGAGSYFWAVSGNLTQTGGSVAVASDTAVLRANNVVLDSGTLSGIGTVNAAVTDGGEISPGNSPGILTINGNYSSTSAGMLTVQLDGAAPGSGYDQLVVNGAVTLDGTLNLKREFASAVGDAFTIINNDGADPVVGAFAGLPEGGIVTAAGMRFQITYHGGTGNDVVLTHINTPPVLDSIDNRTVIQGEMLTFTAAASDVEAPPQSIAFSLDPGAPDGASIDPVSGVFSWTPDAAQLPGDYPVIVRVTDNGAPPLSDARSFMITVQESNRPPTADAGGPYTVAEGGSVQLKASGSDPDRDPLTYSWDLDNDGTFETSGQNVTFSATDRDGPSSQTVNLRVTDNKGASAISTTAVNVMNVAPTAALAASPVTYGAAVAACLTDAFDPSPADALCLHFAFALNPAELDSVTYAAAATDNSASYRLNAGTYTIYARVIDKDDGFTQYHVDVTVFKAEQTIHWSQPASILYGTALGDNQLNATVSAPGPDPVAGALTYLPAAGTVLPVGVHILTATAAETANYRQTTASVELEVIPPASLSGFVFVDVNNDGELDFGESSLAGVTITLTGADDLGQAVSRVQQSDIDGAYLFLNLRPGTYTVTESQPSGYGQGINHVGTAGGTAALDQFFVELGEGIDGLNYNFAERPAAGAAVTSGQTAGIGFWNNKHGQELIKALNGGSSATQLGGWLAATFVNMFGANAGSDNLAGKTNAEVAVIFQQKFVAHGTKVEAQSMATALSVYVTNEALAGSVATPYGFKVDADGAGTATFNVGTYGSAVGKPDNTTMTILDILLAVDSQAVSGKLYNGDLALRNLANDLLAAINEAGSI